MRAATFAVVPIIHLALAIQPSAPDAQPAALRPLQWGKLNFLQTTDTHGWHAGHLQEPQYSADFGDYYSFTVRMREFADKQGVDLLIMDTGDRIEGSGLSDASDPKGKYVREIFSTVDMDVVTIGNHELYKEESSANEYLIMRPHYGERYVVSNVDIYAPDTGELVPLGNHFRKFITKNQGIRVTAFAFLFDFTGNYNNTVVYPVETMIKQQWFLDAISDPEVDVFVVIGHTPVRDSPEFPAILAAIRTYQPNIPVQFLGGHTHIRDFAVYDDFSTGLESGRYCETVGFLSISHIPSKDHPDKKIKFSRSYIDFNRFGFQQHSHTFDSQRFDTEKGLALSRRITEYRSSMGLDKVFGCAPQDYYMFRVPYPHPNSLYSLLDEQILPKMVYNPDRKGVPTLIYINTGSQRFDIFKGQFTTDTSYYVSPFTSTFRYLPNVPYSIAKRLIKLFNRSKEPWMLLSEDGAASDDEVESRVYTSSSSIPPISPLEQYYHFRKLAANSDTRQLPNQEQQIPLGPSHLSHPHHRLKTASNINKIKSSNHEIHLRPSPLTPGYTTFDDFGHDGDDTPHEPIIFNYLPPAIVANRSFDGLEEEPESVDVVFMDFIEPYILAGLRILGKQYRKGDSKPYMPKGEEKKTLTEMMVEWVQSEWQGEC